MPCRIGAILNDTVAVLSASCYTDQATEMGIILGTGTNACITLPVGALQRGAAACSFGSGACVRLHVKQAHLDALAYCVNPQ